MHIDAQQKNKIDTFSDRFWWKIDKEKRNERNIPAVITCW